MTNCYHRLIIIVLLVSGALANSGADYSPGTDEQDLYPNGLTSTTAAPITQSPSTSTSPANVDDGKPPSPNDTKTTPTVSPPSPSSSTTTTTSKPKNKPSDTKNCPNECQCIDTKISCHDSILKTLPTFNSKIGPITELVLNNNSIETVNLNLLPFIATLETIDLAENRIKTIVVSNKKQIEFTKLKLLNLGSNQIESLANLSSFKMPNLEAFNVSANPLSKLTANDFSNMKNLKYLRVYNTKVKSIDESTFYPLAGLKYLDLSNADLAGYHWSDQLFQKNEALETLRLNSNQLIEVPVALRSTRNLKKLTLNNNLMTSLRPSDFTNLTSLVELRISYCPNLTKIDEYTFSQMVSLEILYLTNNPKLHYFSKDAFKSEDSIHSLKKIYISGNNFTTLSNPFTWPSLKLDYIYVGQNPWNCVCEHRWLMDYGRQVFKDGLSHCRGPYPYNDLEISQFFATTDCEAEESGYHGLIVGTFLMFLLCLTVAVFIQKTDVCRRLQLRDQYSTIYYKKASFQTETV